MVSGERRTVKDDQYFIDDRTIIWGKGEFLFIIYGESSQRRFCIL
jgi:hypothetical protein